MLDAKGESKLRLDSTDAVIVLRMDGTCEVSLPEIVGDRVPENIVMGAAVVYALQDEELYMLIHDHFKQRCTQGGLVAKEALLS